MTITQIPGATGRFLLSALDYWLDLFAFVLTALRDWFKVGALKNRANRQSLVTQIIFTGIGALPIVGLLAIITAVGFTSQMFVLSNELGKEIDVAARISYFVFYELAPLMTALVIISRSGSAITVDIGNMKLRREIDGLVLLGIDIDDYIVAPRIIAGTVCQIVLSIYFAVIALYGGLIAAGVLFSTSHFLLIDDVFKAVPLNLAGWFLLKNALFGMIIAGSACFQALQVNNDATALPQQTQKAIVRALAQVFLLNIFFMVIAN